MPKRVLTALALLCAAASTAGAVEVTANGGYMSEYLFRGIPQDDSSAMGGLDISHQGFYLGTWGADVGEGLEVDFYGGYQGSVGDFSYGAGVTYYTYTDDFDDDYFEVNLSLGWKIFSIEAAIGEYENFDGPTEDYTYFAPKVEYRGFYALAGFFGDDFDGEHYEAGYASTFEPIGVDYGLSVIYSSDELLGEDSGSTSLVFSISKTFDLLK